jgi:hypothetical protein
MQNFIRIILLVMAMQTASVAANPDIGALLQTETKIAYQQGKFGALYARCGARDEMAFIGGSVINWRHETFLGYNGGTQDLAALEQAFDQAIADVNADKGACDDWRGHAAAAWSAVVKLAQQGTPVASDRNKKSPQD